MADAIGYQLINKTGSQLNLIATVQNPTNWLPAAPVTIAAGGDPSLNWGSADGVSGAIVLGYSMEGASADQFWIIGNNLQVTQFAPSGHSIGVNVSGDSEDGWIVAVTYQ